jgi:hypothetical protein
MHAGWVGGWSVTSPVKSARCLARQRGELEPAGWRASQGSASRGVRGKSGRTDGRDGWDQRLLFGVFCFGQPSPPIVRPWLSLLWSVSTLADTDKGARNLWIDFKFRIEKGRPRPNIIFEMHLPGTWPTLTLDPPPQQPRSKHVRLSVSTRTARVFSYFRFLSTHRFSLPCAAGTAG